VIGLMLPLIATAQSFTESDVDRLMNSYEMGASDEMKMLKIELLDSVDGFKLLQGAEDSTLTRIFIEFGRRNESESIPSLEQISLAAGFNSLDEWALLRDRVIGIANAGLLTGWGLHSKDRRYNDPDFPDVLKYLKDSSVPWANRALAIQEFELWCKKVCVSTETMEQDKEVLAPRYLEVVMTLLPKES